MEKSKEEILTDFGCLDIPYDEHEPLYYPAILSAMDEFANQRARQMVEKFVTDNAYPDYSNRLVDMSKEEVEKWLTDQGLSPRSEENDKQEGK